MSDLKSMQAKRETMIALLTRLQDYLDSIKNLEVNKSILEQLQIRLDKTEPLWGEFQSLQMKIENKCEKDDPQLVLAGRLTFENLYFDIISAVKLFIKSKDIPLPSQTQLPLDPTKTVLSNINNIKLPAISVPNFTGSYEQWPEFHDTFTTLVHKNNSINDIQKFYYLKDCLKMDAAQVIESIEVSALNYTVAWQLLCERFENKALITHNHVSALFDIPKIHKESHTLLRQLLNNFLKHLRALDNLGEETSGWDRLLIHIVVSKLDSVTEREWKSYISHIKNDLPKFEDLKTFLKNRCDLLETLTLESSSKLDNKQKKDSNHASYHSTIGFYCNFCKESHNIYNCNSFLKLSVATRIAEAKKLGLCINCLRKNHLIKDCKSTRNCLRCNKRHNTLLHVENSSSNSQGNSSTSAQVNSSNQIARNADVSIVSHTTNSGQSSQILLSTANVQISDSRGRLHNCRVLLDSGSQSNFVTEELCSKLSLQKININSLILGINQNASNITHKTEIRIHSNHNNFSVTVSCLVLNQITEHLPLYSFDSHELSIPKNIRLADSAFNKSQKIDILLGAAIFWQLLCVGQIHLGKNKPTLQKTKLGWVIAGPLPYSSDMKINKSVGYFSTEQSLETQVSKFWKVDDCEQTNFNFSQEEQEVEQHFIDTFRRDSNGRFIVSIPTKNNVSCLGESRSAALNRFYHMERKLNQNPNLKLDYITFMDEYQKLNHMTKICEDMSNQLDIINPSYYLPHHAVLKETSLTTKIRVVFDGSSRTSTGLSLNDVQKIGPTIQSDLFSIILRFRKCSYVMTADIEKMYRQVLLRVQDRDLHRIFWRTGPEEDINCFQLNTVTYGTASAAYLSVRCLRQLAIENKEHYPIASDIIDNDFYVDDLLTGSDSLLELKQIRLDVSRILLSGGFHLRKWLSNEPKLFDGCYDANQDHNILQFDKVDFQTKTLGIIWDAKQDTFNYSIRNFNDQRHVTKRTILSITAQIFDPLGLLNPITIIAKLIIQKLWQLKLSWDESIPSDLNSKWFKFRDQLANLNAISIPRHALLPNVTIIEMHGFADSSESAYGTCIYIRCIDNSGACSVKLLCAKSRVAPLKSITLPRLELCAAVLLANLAKQVNDSMNISFNNCMYWSDSTITLGWISAPPQRWKTFVANRVSEIQSLTNIKNWRHVKTSENPADLISRGVLPIDLKASSLWWHGPHWLSETNLEWPTEQNVNLTNLPDTKNTTFTFFANFFDFDLFSRFSSLYTLQKIFAYILRFIFNLRNTSENRLTNYLSVSELNRSLLTLIKIAQAQTFNHEVSSLKNGKELNSKSRLLSLNPFVDTEGILRVGGRLRNSNFSFSKKYPIVLPSHHPLTKLIVRQEHIRLMHCGPQQLLASLRENYWPLSGRNVSKEIVHKCVVCFKVKPKHVEALMGSLPTARTCPSFPFMNTGIDYAGPLFIRDKKSRGFKLIKCYIAVFVCFSTKAMHLELVTDLSSENFIATLRRFIARRGKPTTLFSDNGSNFIGANSQLKELAGFLKSNDQIIQDSLSRDGISWKFIPPKAPNFGGLWEAGVRSIKNHLKRVVGDAHLTYEELSTVLTQIEAILNSRPLSPLSSDPSDMNPITPAHFLIGRSLVNAPDPSVKHINENKLSMYQRLQRITQHFWSRWSKEYISELQIRVKWKKNYSNLLYPGVLVIIREENLPPLRWRLGRVLEMHPGPDGIIRVATVQCSEAKYKRSISKLCVLPSE